MKVTILNDSTSYKTFEVLLEEGEGMTYCDRVATRLSQSHPIKGFRPGAAPFEVVEKALDTELINQTLAKEIAGDTLPKLLKAQNVSFIGEPHLRFTQLQRGNPITFEVTLALWPNVSLPDYKSITVKGVLPQVTDKELAHALEYIKASRKAHTIDDAFARSLGNFETLEDLKHSIHEGILHEKKEQQLRQKRGEILETIRKSATIDIAPLLVDREAERVIEKEVQIIKSQGEDMQDYLKKNQMSEKEFINKATERARMGLENAFILHAIAQKEAISVNDEEVDTQLSSLLSRFPDPEKAAKELDPQTIKQQLRGQLLEEKVFREVLDKQIEIRGND